MTFKNARQENLFGAVVRNLEHLGYRGELLQRDYAFPDWFEPHNPQRIIPAAAFGQTPQSYDSACFAVLLSNGRLGPELVGECRALGAPYAFEVRDDVIVEWRVSSQIQASRELRRIGPNEVDRVFEENRASWAGGDVLRSKGISFRLGPRQLDFIDLGLIPALEEQISFKLDRILKELVEEATRTLKQKHRNNPNGLRTLYRLVFRFLAGKILHDRGIPPFLEFSEISPRSEILRAVSAYYGESASVDSDANLNDLLAKNIWTKLDFRNLSVEVLAYIYENTFVATEARKKLGTHSTPHSVARYVVHQIPFERLPQDERQTLEPFCGHSIFLVAALQRLRGLLPAGMSGEDRHNYFVRMLTGFEIDEFALEVSRLCLLLADFPNHNGWQLNEGDVFSSNDFTKAVRNCHVILSNPPFEDFSASERGRHLSSVHKPAEFLDRVLRYLPIAGMLGIVFPRQFLDGRGYRQAREKIYRRFDEVQLVTLPDGVFEKSDAETVLVIGTEPRTQRSAKLSISFVEVSERDRTRFMNRYENTRCDQADETASEAIESLNVVRLHELWVQLEAQPKLGSYAAIHRGVEWQPPFDEAHYISEKPKKGFRKGLYRAQDLFAFALPKPVYLATRAQGRRGRAFDLNWRAPKAFVNAVPVSRGPWKMVSSFDTSGLLCSQNFHALWPKAPWTPTSVAAILNSPIANAFVDAHEDRRHIRKRTLENLPLPQWGAQQIAALERLVLAYQRAVVGGADYTRAQSSLLEIDAFILKGYAVAPRLERNLLDLFQGERRPVPFRFSDYFSADFEPTIPLWMYVSPEYQRCSARYFMEKAPLLTDPALIEVLEDAAE